MSSASGGEALNRFAEQNPRLWALLEHASLLVLASLAFQLFALAVLTIPAALAALMAAVGAFIQPAGPDGLVRFWRGFRRTGLTATLLGLIDLALGLLFWLDIRFFAALEGWPGTALALLAGSLAILLLLMNVYAWPLLAWYPQPLGKLLRRSFLLTAAHPFWAMAGLGAAFLILLALWSLPGPARGLTLITGPAAAAAALAACAWQAMRRYAGPDDTFAE